MLSNIIARLQAQCGMTLGRNRHGKDSGGCWCFLCICWLSSLFLQDRNLLRLHDFSLLLLDISHATGEHGSENQRYQLLFFRLSSVRAPQVTDAEIAAVQEDTWCTQKSATKNQLRPNKIHQFLQIQWSTEEDPGIPAGRPVGIAQREAA